MRGNCSELAIIIIYDTICCCLSEIQEINRTGGKEIQEVIVGWLCRAN
jgi:hypothetical protein